MINLRQFLTQAENQYHRSQYLNSDPVEYVHHYSDPWDQEAVAVLCAALAYGNVKQIRRSIKLALSHITTLASSPQEFVRSLEQKPFKTRALREFKPFVHRFNTGEDVIHLYEALSLSWRKYQSLGGHFLTLLSPSDTTIEPALNTLLGTWKLWLGPQKTEGSTAFFLSSPKSGSACKRWCMFLRWMGRKDEIDLGLWTHTSPLRESFPSGHGLRAHQLIMPLDTHTARISQTLRLTQRKSADWKAALEVTATLKRMDPEDPIRYDFALSRLGILNLWDKAAQDPSLKR
ncbi:TIGR02757 family protein [bacterium]|nr:TIGR02757 family protein [bacterium]